MQDDHISGFLEKRLSVLLGHVLGVFWFFSVFFLIVALFVPIQIIIEPADRSLLIYSNLLVIVVFGALLFLLKRGYFHQTFLGLVVGLLVYPTLFIILRYDILHSHGLLSLFTMAIMMARLFSGRKFQAFAYFWSIAIVLASAFLHADDHLAFDLISTVFNFVLFNGMLVVSVDVFLRALSDALDLSHRRRQELQVEVTERTRAEAQLRQYAARLELLQKIDRAMLASGSPAELASVALAHVRRLVPAQRVSINLFDFEARTSSLLAVNGAGPSYLSSGPAISFEEYGLPAIEELQKGNPYLLENFELELDDDELNQRYLESGVRAWLCCPMIYHGQLIGALNLAHTTTELFVEDDIQVLCAVSNQLAIAIEHHRLFEEVEKLNASLKRDMAERNIELEKANEELQTLSYTIGHDLRSPIRAMVAYSHMLIDDLSGRVAAADVERLERIHHVARRMGRMVDDFLTFLRLSRIHLHKKQVDLGSLTQAIFDEMAGGFSEREIHFSVQDVPSCYADERLMRHVITLLLENAIKFTSSRNPAEIVFGSMPHESGHCYFLQDNGIGFDMHYVDKLFGLFERLHHPDEYEGSGMGLAIMKRIILRHGGQVWADAKINKGATIYFTLPGV